MSVTPDRWPGIREEESIHLETRDSGTDPTVVGELLFADGQFKLRDAIGVFDPRVAGSRVGLLIFKIDGGLIYNSAGEPLLKVSE